MKTLEKVAFGALIISIFVLSVGLFKFDALKNNAVVLFIIGACLAIPSIFYLMKEDSKP